MTAGLLPLEKIPVFIWGAVLAIVGVVLAFQAEPFSWAQVKAVSLIALGFAAVIYDVANRCRRLDQSRADERSGGAPSDKA